MKYPKHTKLFDRPERGVEAGYYLVQVLMADELVEAENERTHPEHTFQTIKSTSHHVVRVPLFLMAKPEDTVEVERADEVRRLKQKLAISEDEKGDIRDALNMEKNDKARVAERLEKVIKCRDELETERNSLHSRARTYENNIAKIRTAIGELRMTEILHAK